MFLYYASSLYLPYHESGILVGRFRDECWEKQCQQEGIRDEGGGGRPLGSGR